ncbi:disease resistance protein [Quercus suber]|uniref:Disease resistance protein n=1 Tax=Quercus suber TaxID=58331 RepID=A0AAW0L0B0_QUESU
MNFRDKIEEKIFEWVFAALGCVLAALGCLLGYLLRYKSKIDNLKTQLEELRGARDRLQHEVDTARRNLMKIEDDVKRRLTESDDVIAGAEKILEDDNRGWYLNMMSRYQVSNRADKAALEAKNLKDEISKIKSVGYHEPTQVVESVTSNKGYEAFESRMPTITGVLEALKDPNIARIGIHGMGGVGKTMLVKEVLKQAEKGKLFDKYLFLVVSNDPDLKRIQREIAEQLGLESVKETELVRRDQLLCNDMDTQKQFEVKVFSNDEARNLFEKIVGDLAKTSEIKPTMLQIVEECAGLPIAITTVANALKNQKNPRIWKDFLNQLKMSSPREIEGMNEMVYKSIKMSYEFLKSNEAKSLLLLCSLHGEDEDIKVEDLLRYGVGLGLFDNVDTIEGARCRVHTLVERLKDSSLLLDGYRKGTVKMHDVIRDVVINIAAEERHMYTIRTVNELQTRSKRKDTVAISLPYINGDLDLPNQFECSKLELLLLFWQKVDFRIPDSFFEGLKDLKVLKLSESWSGVLPSSLSSLENLQTLCLTGEVQNAIIIGELKNLKALSLSLSYTEWLPKEIGQLTHLQLLDLEEWSELNFIPPNVLSNLTGLEELYLPDDVKWEVEVQSTEIINAMVSELDHLSHLTKLHICIENAKILPDAKVFERLESYRIGIGSARFGHQTSGTSRILNLNRRFQSDHGYKVLFRKCETLVLEKMKGVKNILYLLESEGFQSLKHLTVNDNDEIQYIIKSMGVLDSVFPSLESINLWNVNNLERICYMQLPTKTFCNLRVVRVSSCCKLEFVFSSSMVGCFSHLQEINIEDCKIMSAIVAIERQEEIEVNSDDNIVFANLHSLKLRNLFKLKGFLSVVDSCVLFNGKVVFPILKKLEIEGMDSMNMIWPDQLISDFFGKLETLTVSGCTNLTNIGPPNMLRTLRNLKELKIEKCGSIEEVFDIQGTNIVEESRDIAAAELISLTLRNLEKVKHVWSMDSQGIISFGKLRTMEIEDCSSLKSVFPTSVAKGLMQLEKLEINDCVSVEEIVAKEEGIEITTLFLFPQLTTLELHNLPELKSFYPGNHTLELPSLTELTIYKCDKLKIFGSNKSSVEETNGLDHHASLILQPLFFVEKDKFPNLEELELDDAMNETCGGPSEEFCCNLKELWLYGNGEIPNVEAPRAGISDFRRLKNIVPFSSTSFHYLKKLHVSGSDVLISLLTPSTARTLVQLQKITIWGCKRMTEIVANEGSEAEAGDEIAFNNLSEMVFIDLPSLTAFHLGNRTIKFPSLVEVQMHSCPKLKIFYSGVLSTPKLRFFMMEGKRITKEEGAGDVDLLNARIKEYWEAKLETCDQKFAEKDKFPNLEILGLDEGDATNETCGRPSEEFCCNLKELSLYGNGEIPNVEAPRAGISDFRRLKNIVPFSSTSFHYLKELRVYGSDVLISLLTPSTARTLVQLRRIAIWECKRMTEIVANEGSEAEAGDEIAFNNLTYLSLIKLPSLTAFHLGNRTIKFPSLESVNMGSCPKLKIFYCGVLSTPKLRTVWMQCKLILIKKGVDGDVDVDLNARIKEYWEAKLETCDQKFAEKVRCHAFMP